MTRTCCSRANLIGEAEALAHHAVVATERRQAAYRAWFLSDPYARSTFRRSLRIAAAEQQSTLGVLFELVEELGREGLASFAANLWQTTIRNCEVAIDLAKARLLRELAALPATDPRKDSHEPEGTQPRAPAARPGRPAEAAGDLSDLYPADPPRPEGRALAVLRGPAEERGRSCA